MPGIDGHTLVRRLSAQKLDTAVLVMSGAGTMDDVVDALRAGAVDYLKKPWSAAELVSAVVRAEEVHDQRRRARLAKEREGPPVSARPADAPPLPPAAAPVQFSSLLEQIRQGGITLPSVPVVVSGLRRLMAQPKAEVIEIANLIERDPALATRLLRLSNAAAYARLGRSSSIRAAPAGSVSGKSRVWWRPSPPSIATSCVSARSARCRRVSRRIPWLGDLVPGSR